MAQGQVFRFDPQPQQRTPTVPLPAQVFPNPPGNGPDEYPWNVLAAWQPVAYVSVPGVQIPQPPPVNNPPFPGALSVPELLIVQAWPQFGEPLLFKPQVGKNFIVAQTLTYGQQPPISGPITPQEQAQLRGAWPEPGEPRLPQPQVGRNYVVALTLKYGQQPPVQGPLSLGTSSALQVAWLPLPPQPEVPDVLTEGHTVPPTPPPVTTGGSQTARFRFVRHGR